MLCARLIRLLLGGFLAASAIAHAEAPPSFEQRANGLFGVWFATEVGGDKKPRVLRITNVKFSDNSSAQYVGYFGLAQGSWTDAQDLVARPSGDQVQLMFQSTNGSRVSLTTTTGGQLFGTVIPVKGEPFSLRFARSGIPEIHQWVAENPTAEARATPNSTIELVYLSASNCGPCRGWEMEYLDQGKLKSAPEWSHMKFTENKRGSFRGKLQTENLPPHLHSIFKELENSRRSLFFGTPTFVVIVNGVVRSAIAGTTNFETLVLPTIKAAVREKLQGTKS